MQIVTITKNEAGQRLDKLLSKYLNLAGKSFIYKMIRKKNITLNGRKCDGSEMLAQGDEIKLFLSDETIEKFSRVNMKQVKKKKLDVVFEDDDIMLINKPAGMLSQKAKDTDESLVEYLIGYLLDNGRLTKEELRQFRPSVCNRLDRNTSGLVIAGKSLPGLQIMSKAIKERTIGKYYLCVVYGRMVEEKEIDGYLIKDEEHNKVRILKRDQLQREDTDAQPIRTHYRPLKGNGRYTLLEVKLITGRSHQIRAHLASIGRPIVGDYKYGSQAVNEEVREKYGIKSQMLHAYRLVMPDPLKEPLSDLSGREFKAPPPKEFERITADMRSF